MSSIDTEVFKSLDVNPGGTLQMCQEYVERLELLFQLVFRKVDGTALRYEGTLSTSFRSFYQNL